jgi:drug/metabolite transporter (DMT)-like permease
MNVASLDQGRARGLLLTAAAMLCFAANSLLCRMALAPHLIDPATFSTVRVASAVAVLTVLVVGRGGRLSGPAQANWWSVGCLLAYLLFFSFAYARLSAGSGALILFGAVQLTMFAAALHQGEHFAPLSWIALAVALLGLVYLVLPGVTAPDPIGAFFMAVAGVAWGIFSLLARGVTRPTEANASNFIYCLPLVAIASFWFSGDFKASPTGLVLAVASGAIASGLGYVIWYAALRTLSRTQAATVQLTVPAIAAFGGVLLLSEPVTIRLVVASCALLGGVAVVIARQSAAS